MLDIVGGMSLGLLGAVFAALCTGCAAVLQAIGARRVTAHHVDPRLFLALLKSWPYVTGLALNCTAFGLSLVALRSLPLFVVQAIVASNLAVVAVLAACVLRARLRVRDWAAVSGVIAGLILLVLSADPGNPAHMATTGQWALLGAAVALGCTMLVPGHKLHGKAALLGMLAGLTYGIVGVASRVLGDAASVHGLLLNPATYALGLGGILGTLLYASAVQRGSVTSASAMTIVGQTLGPAVVGWFLLGDHSRPGFTLIAIAGFVLTVAGAVALARHARHGHIEIGHRHS
ncbi:MAG: DMT family transporter [Streptosporangiaceae bacterium]